MGVPVWRGQPERCAHLPEVRQVTIPERIAAAQMTAALSQRVSELALLDEFEDELAALLDAYEGRRRAFTP